MLKYRSFWKRAYTIQASSCTVERDIEKKIIQALHCFPFPLLIRNKSFRLLSPRDDRGTHLARLPGATGAALAPAASSQLWALLPQMGLFDSLQWEKRVNSGEF